MYLRFHSRGKNYKSKSDKGREEGGIRDMHNLLTLWMNFPRAVSESKTDGSVPFDEIMVRFTLP